MMDYTTEELVPIIGRLAQTWTGNDHTSISYEHAQQLMEAVQYCLQVVSDFTGEDNLRVSGLSAEAAYEVGHALVHTKTRQTLVRMNTLLKQFDAYDNRCLYDTVVKGLPQFFKHYDTRYAPQRTWLTLDYPVIGADVGLCGIARIADFIAGVEAEQQLLHWLPRESVLAILAREGKDAASRVENICEPVLMTMVAHWLVRRPFAQTPLAEDDRRQLHVLLLETLPSVLEGAVQESFAVLLAQEMGIDEAGVQRLLPAVSDGVKRLKLLAENNALAQFV